MATSVGLSGCGASGAGGDGKVTLRFAWWGGDLRNKMTTEVIAAFEQANPNIKIAPEPGSFEGYFDKLATQVASGNAPDVIQMPDGYFNEYVGRGALLDLTKLPIDHTDIDDAVWNTGVVGGKIYGVPNGVNTHVVIANPDLFKKAGVPLPDDKTWTWEDYQKTAQALSDKLPDNEYGSSAFGLDQNGLAVWLRQHGKQLFTFDRKLGFQAADAAPFFELLKKMSDSGAVPKAEEVSEQVGVTLEQSGTATGHYAMGWWASNQVANLNTASGKELKILRLPTVDGIAANAKFAIGGGWYTASAKTKYPDAVAKFMNFVINDRRAGEILLTERGAPANTKIRKALQDSGKLTPADSQSIDFLNALSEVAMNPPPAVPPVGAGGFQDILRRYTVEVLFGREAPASAAQKLIDEANASIK
ncbi:sugar ABC transporter substrate-binding protein [Nonomuraea sp. NPDC005650]|uniref:ABC transporter substrate-binding protein n=1 Tax=Nonomuraea sp. NPDC005650 TaxID=3157045 RepID=UPI0033A40F36